jgi:peptide/nickel transport system permease protein
MMLLVLLGILIITFLVSHVVPSDPARLWAGSRATKEQVEQTRVELGLDKPLHIQFLIYLSKLLQGDLGRSFYTRRPVAADLLDYFPATFELTTVAFILSIIIGIPLGVISAIKKDTVLDHAARIFCMSGVSMPVFWLGLMLQLLFCSTLHILPSSGRMDYFTYLNTPIQRITGMYLLDSLITGNWPAFLSAAKHIFLPAITLSYVSLVLISRITRSSMIEALQQEYIRTARAKGLPEKIVIYKHALKNALLPTTTLAGLTYGFMLGGSVLLESIYDWPGIGLYAMRSALIIDYPAIIGATLLFTIVYTTVNLIVDLLYAFIDPRIRYG